MTSKWGLSSLVVQYPLNSHCNPTLSCQAVLKVGILELLLEYLAPGLEPAVALVGSVAPCPSPWISELPHGIAFLLSSAGWHLPPL